MSVHHEGRSDDAGEVMSPSERNAMRRARAGITLLRDVVVPVRDGTELLADVFHPSGGRPSPAILRVSVYGKAFRRGSICSDADAAEAERREDAWFQRGGAHLPSMFRYCENMVSANAHVWVPRGYAVVRADGRGTGRSPGVLEPFSLQEAEDYYDVIEWCATQPWCDGSVALYGSSYAATIQWNVAALQPPSLRAIVPFAGDSDPYRDLAYPGGIFNESYRVGWWSGVVRSAQCGQDAVDLIADMQAHPFDDGDYHGCPGRGPLSADFSRVDVPVLTAVSQTASLHGRSGFDAFEQLRGYRELLVVDADYFGFMYGECDADVERFLARYLKGTVPEQEPAPVRMIMRTGHHGYVWRDSETWPVPGTVYESLCFDASTLTLGAGPSDDGVVEYSADVDDPNGLPTVARFVAEPLTDDLHLAGRFAATLWVSSSSSDMDVFVALRVLDGQGQEVPYSVREAAAIAPVTWGCLKVSHRMLDRERCVPNRPWHTHRSVDALPLRGPDEVVEIEIDLLPATAFVPAGHRLCVDVTPIEGPGARLDDAGNPTRRRYDVGYHRGASNCLHTGPGRKSALSLPVVPPV